LFSEGKKGERERGVGDLSPSAGKKKTDTGMGLIFDTGVVSERGEHRGTRQI